MGFNSKVILAAEFKWGVPDFDRIESKLSIVNRKQSAFSRGIFCMWKLIAFLRKGIVRSYARFSHAWSTSRVKLYAV